MTNYNLIGNEGDDVIAPHRCTSDLAQLQQHEGTMWECVVCRKLVLLEEVVEMLRERAVAQDTALRLQFLRGTPDPVPGSVIGHAPAEHTCFKPLIYTAEPGGFISPKKLREQGGL